MEGKQLINEMISTLECGVSKECDIPHFLQVIDVRMLHAKQEAAREQARDGSSMSIAQEIDYLKATSCVSAYRPIYSCRKVVGPIIVFFKKVIRKLIKFYVEPITLDQSDRNAHIAQTLEMIELQVLKQEEEISRLKKQLND